MRTCIIKYIIFCELNLFYFDLLYQIRSRHWGEFILCRLALSNVFYSLRWINFFCRPALSNVIYSLRRMYFMQTCIIKYILFIVANLFFVTVHYRVYSIHRGESILCKLTLSNAFYSMNLIYFWQPSLSNVSTHRGESILCWLGLSNTFYSLKWIYFL